MRRIENENKLNELHTRGQGFIYNDYSGTGAAGGQYNVLHVASCRWILKSNTRIPKYYASNLAEAERWLLQHRGQEGIGWKRCGTCHAGPAPAAPHDQTTGRSILVPAHPSPREPRQPAGRPYLVRTMQAQSGTIVEAWSKQRLQFQPRGWQVAFRNELRYALGRLTADSHQLLHAVYASEQQDYFDVENVLFYNVGAASLARAGRYGVRCERSYHVPAPPGSFPGPALHYHGYRLQPSSGSFTHWQDGSALARWQLATGERSDLTDCTRLWLQLKMNGRIEAARTATDQPFILRTTVAAPATARFAATDLIKPLIDGVVCAFHRHNGQDQQELCRRLAARTGIASAILAAFLNDDTYAALGTRRLLWARGAGVQWNPADELCVAAELHVQPGVQPTGYRVHGELLTARYVDNAQNRNRPR